MEERVIRSLSLEGGESEQAAHPMIDLLEEECWQISPQRGDIIEGTIVSVSPTEAFPSGRARVNCTMRARNEWYWFGQEFLAGGVSEGVVQSPRPGQIGRAHV